MGMYTGLKLKCELDPTMENEWRPVLTYMLISSNDRPKIDFEMDHPLFGTDRWEWMLRGTSAYLEPEFGVDSRLEGNNFQCSFNIKNYSSEIDHFLDWIGQFVSILHEGKWQYEEMEKPAKVVLDRSLEVIYE